MSESELPIIGHTVRFTGYGAWELLTVLQYPGTLDGDSKADA